ncbi:MAG: NAD(P)-binding domain-containing protein [Candidatus Hodarchaeota archaeon]
MIERVGIIGVGHLASYIVEGLKRSSEEIEIIMSPRNRDRVQTLSTKFNAIVATNNQEIADSTELIILSTRPKDSVAVAADIGFHPGQTVISVAAGLPLETLRPAIEPAMIVRAMPISSAAINRSPTLLYPDHPQARELFSLLGQVLILPEESLFTPASVIAAFYGWVYALMDETIKWTIQEGVPSEIAKNLVIRTIQGAVEMSLANQEQDLTNMLSTLVTKGGITEYGLSILNQKKGIKAWTDALEAVHKYLHSVT